MFSTKILIFLIQNLYITIDFEYIFFKRTVKRICFHGEMGATIL